MGWPTEGETGNVLQDALDTCGLETGGDVSNCAAFAPYLDTSGGCKPQMPIVNEVRSQLLATPALLPDVPADGLYPSSPPQDDGLGTPISKLPGNNPLWIGNGTKPSDPDYDTTSPGFKAVKAVLPEGWNRTGCIADAKSGRALSAASYASDDMTLATCATFCGGLSLPYAGVEYGRECYVRLLTCVCRVWPPACATLIRLPPFFRSAASRRPATARPESSSTTRRGATWAAPASRPTRAAEAERCRS